MNNTQTKVGHTKFANYKEACDYCAAINVSNECVGYDPTANKYSVRTEEEERADREIRGGL